MFLICIYLYTVPGTFAYGLWRHEPLVTFNQEDESLFKEALERLISAMHVMHQVCNIQTPFTLFHWSSVYIITFLHIDTHTEYFSENIYTCSVRYNLTLVVASWTGRWTTSQVKHDIARLTGLFACDVADMISIVDKTVDACIRSINSFFFNIPIAL